MNTEDIKNMTTAYLQVLEESKKKKDGMNKMPDEPMMEKEKKKLDPVDKNALKGDHDDREDGDIDNDGDTDASDEYLHNRRKTIKKSMKSEETQLDELSPRKLGSYIKKAHDDSSDFQNSAKRKKGIMRATNKLVKKAGGRPTGSMFDESKMAGWVAIYNGKKVEIKKSEANDLYGAKMKAAKMLKVPKSKMGLLAIEPGYNEEVVQEAGAERMQWTASGDIKQGWALIDTADGNKVRALSSHEDHVKSYRFQKIKKGLGDKNTLKIVKLKKAVGPKKASSMIGYPLKEEVENRWPIYNKIMENRDMQTKGATEPEGMYSKSSEGEKAFIAMHTPNGAVDPRFDANVAAEKTAQSIANSVKPGTGNDASGNAVPGDKTIRK
jgi:hypothetical protein